MPNARHMKRRALFVRKDEIQAKRDKLTEELESQPGQQVAEVTVLCCQWVLS